MRRGVAALSIVLVATGCMGGDDPPGSVGPLEVTGQGTMRFVPERRAETSVPPVGLTHMHFFDRRRGIGATNAGFHYERHVGYAPARDAARIVTTRDGGGRWRTVWKLRGASFTALEFVDRMNGVAVGHRVIGAAIPSYGAVGRPFVVRTHDGGRSWLRLDAPAHSVRPADAKVWYAAGSGKLFLTRDGGGTWRRIAAPAGLVSVEPVSHDVAIAIAGARSCSSGRQLWRTTDRGGSWTPLTGTCAASFTAVDFSGPVGYAATGHDENAHGFRSLLATTDGGRSWTTRFRDGQAFWPPISELRFATPRDGWAYGLDSYQPHDAEALFVTHDGGRHWRSTHFPGRPSAVLGGRTAWVGDDRDAALWRTANAGQSWRVAAGRSGTEPYRLLAASRDRILVDTPVGTLESRDDGRTWSTRPELTERQIARLRGERVYDSPLAETPARLVSTGRPAPVPPATFGFGFPVFSGSEHAVAAVGEPSLGDLRRPVFSTSDGGRSWRTLTFPAGLNAYAPVELGAGLVVVPSAYPDRALLLTHDEGRRWRRTATPADYYSCDLSVRRPELWIACPGDVSSATVEPSLLLVSRDDGEGWTRRTTRRALSQVVSVGPGEAWAIAGTLVHTLDGGKTWAEVPPSLSPGARAFRLRPRWPPRY
jgi:photosystem II stability/assembly factor-like uncharacterized protein